MRKSPGNERSHEEGQADLFGAAPPALRKSRVAKTTRVSPPPVRAHQSTKPAPPDALLNVRQAAARLGLSKSTLDKMRGKSKGPRFIRSTDRAIRYDPKDLDAWIEARRG
ncbi:MAG: helix-turn-helix transcriptional regulator [Hyphomonadaceae bacterium]